MSYPVPVEPEVAKMLRLTSSNDLQQLRSLLISVAEEDDDIHDVAAVIGYELALREVEPISRKLRRAGGQLVEYCKTNPEKVEDGLAKAAVVGLAVALGMDLSDGVYPSPRCGATTKLRTGRVGGRQGAGMSRVHSCGFEIAFARIGL
ncbi:MAG TPA: hypothetical protein VGM03_21045 [Phycisphaerae bacterium]|jgi:hypothetical protein